MSPFLYQDAFSRDGGGPDVELSVEGGVLGDLKDWEGSRNGSLLTLPGLDVQSVFNTLEDTLVFFLKHKLVY